MIPLNKSPNLVIPVQGFKINTIESFTTSFSEFSGNIDVLPPLVGNEIYFIQYMHQIIIAPTAAEGLDVIISDFQDVDATLYRILAGTIDAPFQFDIDHIFTKRLQLSFSGSFNVQGYVAGYRLELIEI